MNDSLRYAVLRTWSERSRAGMPPRGWAAHWSEFTVHGGAVTSAA